MTYNKCSINVIFIICYIKLPEWLHGYITVAVNSATGFHKMEERHSVGLNSGSMSLSTSQGRLAHTVPQCESECTHKEEDTLDVCTHEEEDTLDVCHNSIPLRSTLGAGYNQHKPCIAAGGEDL